MDLAARALRPALSVEREAAMASKAARLVLACVVCLAVIVAAVWLAQRLL